MNKFLKISWWNDHDLGDVVYQSGYRNKIYLDVEVDEPQYQTSIESDLNGDNQEITKFRKWEKIYNFKCWMTEDLVDAFSFMQIHDNIEVTLQTGQLIEVARHKLRSEPKWEAIGCLAEVTVTFTEDYVVAGNCDENKLSACLCDEFGEINVIDEFPGTTAGDGQIGLLWTVENVADKKYTGSLYEYTNNGQQWIPIADPEQFSCFENTDQNNKWIWDGQYWILFPGFISSITQPNPAVNNILVKGDLIYGTFCDIYVLLGIGWTNFGSYTLAEINAGVTLSIPENGTFDIKLKVWNHSCDYGYTEEEEFSLLTNINYGLLYNWYAATDARKITSSNSWIVPDKTDYDTLNTYLGGSGIAGGKLKEAGLTYWDSPNTGATNETYFNGRGGGSREANGNFSLFKAYSVFWTKTVGSQAYYFILEKINDDFANSQFGQLKAGCSVRLVKTSTTLSDGETGVYTGNDGKAYRTICIGTQEWLADNLAETKYRNGDDITEVTDNATWAALATEAMCAYNNDWNNV